MNTEELRQQLENWYSKYQDQILEITRGSFEKYNDEDPQITLLLLDLQDAFITLNNRFYAITNYIDLGELEED